MEILFLLRKNKRNPYKSATLYCRLTVDGKRANADFSTFVKVDPDEWNPKAQKIISKKSGTEQDNDTLDNIRNSLKDIFNDFIRKQRPVTAQAIKMEYLQSTKPGFSFLQIFKQLIERKRAKNLAIGTVRHNESKFRNVERFLQSINRVDLLPGEFTLKMADDLDYFLRTTLPSCSHNHVMKHLQLIKQVLKYAARQGFIIH